MPPSSHAKSGGVKELAGEDINLLSPGDMGHLGQELINTREESNGETKKGERER